MVPSNHASDHILIRESESIQNLDELNAHAQKLEGFFLTLSGKKKKFGGLTVPETAKRPNPNKQKCKGPTNKYAMQSLYDQRPHRAMQEILLGPSNFCDIDPITIEKHFLEWFREPMECKVSDLAPFLWQNTAPNEAHNAALTEKFNCKSVKSKLLIRQYDRFSKARSIGIDQIKYKDLLKYDPDCSILTAFFNACMRLEKIPNIWKETHSVLIKNSKIDDDAIIKNWHLVTMHSTTAKLFQSLLASRLIVWAKNTKRLSETQKGMLMNEAACEGSFILQECKKYAEKNKKNLVVAWLDFTNATDSLPHESILQVLVRHSVPAPIRNVIASILKDAKTFIRTMSIAGRTDFITNERGLPLGAPINPILLDLVMEPILRNLSAENNKFKIFSQKLNHFVIQNELTLIADSTSELQKLLNSVEKTAKALGLKFNINKCYSFNFDSKNNTIQESNLLFFGQKLSTVPKEKINEYFGVKQGLSIVHNDIPTITEMITSLKALDESLLNSFQKINFLDTLIIPRVENCLRGLPDIDNAVLEEANKIFDDKIKLWLVLPDDMMTESIVFQVSSLNTKGKKNYLPLLDLLRIMKIEHAFKMLTSKDKIVKCIAFDSLTAEVSELIHKKPKDSVTKEDLAKYLSGDLHIKNVESSTFWQIVRESTLSLKMKINVAWEWKSSMHIVSKNKEGKLDAHTSRNVSENLKKNLINYYVDSIKKNYPECAENTSVIVPTIQGYKKDRLTKKIPKKVPIKTNKPLGHGLDQLIIPMRNTFIC